MFILTYALPIAAALLLIVFFSGLPLLSACALPGAHDRRFDRRDGLILAVITLLYAAVAFYALGNTRSPESFVPSGIPSPWPTRPGRSASCASPARAARPGWARSR